MKQLFSDKELKDKVVARVAVYESSLYLVFTDETFIVYGGDSYDTYGNEVVGDMVVSNTEVPILNHSNYKFLNRIGFLTDEKCKEMDDAKIKREKDCENAKEYKTYLALKKKFENHE